MILEIEIGEQTLIYNICVAFATNLKNKLMEKKLLTVVISGLFFWSCSTQDMEEITSNKCDIENIDSFYVSCEEAIEKAETFLSQNTPATRAAVNRRILNHTEISIGQSATRSSAEDVDVRFHLINFADNAGYALVSSDSRTTAIYAYSTTGNLDYDEAVENTGFGVFMESVADYYIDEIDNFKSVTPPPFGPVIRDPCEIAQLPIEEYDDGRYYVRYGASIRDEGVGPLVNANWKQKWPYNSECPSCSTRDEAYGFRSPAGCGPVAAGQIMAYYQYPSSFNNVIFDWNQINSSAAFPEYYNPDIPVSAGAGAVAKLLYTIGVDAQAEYGHNTSTYPVDIANTFRHFGYSLSGPTTYSKDRTLSSLDDNRPVLMVGYKTNNVGHAWVVDGYENHKYFLTYYKIPHPHEVYTSFYYHNRVEYLHCNWGWGGDLNSWVLDTFNEYTENLNIIYNIRH